MAVALRPLGKPIVIRKRTILNLDYFACARNDNDYSVIANGMKQSIKFGLPRLRLVMTMHFAND